MKNNYSRNIGLMGENVSAEFLKNKGYTVTERNFHSRFGEIDIIAEDSVYIVFAEVKTRSVNALAVPSEWVDLRKQRKIIMTAERYLFEHEKDLQPRFDVIEVVYEPKTMTIISLEHIENAFSADGY